MTPCPRINFLDKKGHKTCKGWCPDCQQGKHWQSLQSATQRAVVAHLSIFSIEKELGSFWTQSCVHKIKYTDKTWRKRRDKNILQGNEGLKSKGEEL